MSVRIAVIGAGVMGADHARIVSGDLPGAILQVVCDSAIDRARAVAERCGAFDVATDAIATVTRRDVDAVLIASPDDTHAPLTVAAIGAGKPTLCEKPLAPSSASCLEVLEHEAEIGRRMIQVGFMRRFDPSYLAMKTALARGDLGGAVMMHNFHRNVEAPDWFTADMAISNSAPHEFDIARFVLEEEIRAITAFQPAVGRVDHAVAPVMMVLETTAGQIVNVEVNNNAAYGYDVRGELVGERGSVFLNSPTHAVYNSDLRSYRSYEPDWRSRFSEAYRRQNKAWLTSVETGKPAAGAASAWDGYCATAVAEAGVRSLASRNRVPIEMAPMPALYGLEEAP